MPSWNVAASSATVVSSTATADRQTQGRARRSGIGWLHHRPLNFQTAAAGDRHVAAATGRGHSASTAAAIAAASSSVAAGVIDR